MKEYFESLQKGFSDAYSIAEKARAVGVDPEEKPEIVPAEDIAARVEGIVGPQGIAKRIRELGIEKKREALAFDIVREIIERERGEPEKVIEQAVRTGVAILTEGVLVAPTEGISSIRIKKNPDGSDYLAMYFSGPIRSAGGTVAALSVVLADFARKRFNIADYRPTDTEVERYVEEIALYDVRAARLQYRPTDDEIRVIVKNCPVCIDGEPTEEFEVSVHKDLPRIETNRVRGGMCLVIAEGIAQKASKVLRYTKSIGLNWSWLEACVKVPKKEMGGEIKPNSLYLDDIVAGRPIFSYPSEKGGFRLRYGRTRMSGIAAKAVHPATMVLLDGFLAIGTQMKVERPGKGCVVTPCSTIEGPFVRMKDGSVLQVKSAEEAERIKKDVEVILSLGDMLVSYGDFYKANHPLMPTGYCEEFWLKELEKSAKEKGVDYKTVLPHELSAEDAFRISERFNIPLHPRYTYNWQDISCDELKELAEWLGRGRLIYDWFKLKELRVENGREKAVLETLCVPHTVEGNEVVVREHAMPLLMSLGMLQNKRITTEKFNVAFSKEKKAIEIVRELAGVKIREKAPVYIGARMGRPEKARERKMKPAPHVLFPIGNWGGKTRDIMAAYRRAKDNERFEGGKVIVEVARMKCPSCGRIFITNKCPLCSSKTTPSRVCLKCGREVAGESCEKCGAKASESDSRAIQLVELVEEAEKRCGYLPAELKGVKGMTSKAKIPEPLEKGILRAKHGVFVFKDGTARFDATNIPLTHFKPNEIGVSVEKLRELGYTKDWEGRELKDGNQLVELKPQDVIISENGGEYLKKVADFVDDELVYLYGLPPYYKLSGKEELVGKLVVTLSPHTSCGVLGRIIGFTKANVGYAHPYMISARRRNADGDEDSTMLLLDALMNFSRRFLPDSRGGTMDACLVLTTSIDPREVDDEVHAMEVCREYPLELYEASLRFDNPAEVRIEKVLDRLGKEEQYTGIGFTHEVGSVENIPAVTNYVKLKTMKEKVDAQFSLSEKIRAVNVRNAAERLILSHFLPDLYGNLRSFSRQVFRCVSCNSKYRRVPLSGKCRRCGGKLVLTISKGGIEKYLKISQELVDRYQLPAYLKQRLQLLESDLSSVFGNEDKKQFSLSEFL